MTITRIFIATFAVSSLTSCYNKADLEERQQTFFELRAKHREMQKGAAAMFKKYTNDVTVARDALAEVQAEEDSIKALIGSKKLEIESLPEEFATYRKLYRDNLYASLMQQTFPSVEIADRGTVTEFQITSLRGDEVYYESADGRGHFPFTEIPPEIRTYLMLDEEAADLEQFPEIVPTPTTVLALPGYEPESPTIPPTDDGEYNASPIFVSDTVSKKREAELDRLYDRRAELSSSSKLIKIKLRMLRLNRTKHSKLVADHGSFQSKRALRAIDDLETGIRDRSAQIERKMVILDMLIRKARVSS